MLYYYWEWPDWLCYLLVFIYLWPDIGIVWLLLPGIVDWLTSDRGCYYWWFRADWCDIMMVLVLLWWHYCYLLLLLLLFIADIICIIISDICWCPFYDPTLYYYYYASIPFRLIRFVIIDTVYSIQYCIVSIVLMIVIDTLWLWWMLHWQYSISILVIVLVLLLLVVLWWLLLVLGIWWCYCCYSYCIYYCY